MTAKAVLIIFASLAADAFVVPRSPSSCPPDLSPQDIRGLWCGTAGPAPPGDAGEECSLDALRRQQDCEENAEKNPSRYPNADCLREGLNDNLKCEIGKLTSRNNPANHQNCFNSAADATWNCQLSERNTQKECIQKGLEEYKGRCPINSRSPSQLSISDCHLHVYRFDFVPCNEQQKETTDEQCKQRATEAYKRQCSSYETQLIQDPFSDCYISALKEWHRCLADGNHNCEQKVKDSGVYERCLKAAKEPQRAANWENVIGPQQEQSGRRPQVPEHTINRPEPDIQPPNTDQPNADRPEVKAPEAKAPEVKAPEAKAPEVKAPQVKASDDRDKHLPQPKGKDTPASQSDRAGAIPQVQQNDDRPEDRKIPQGPADQRLDWKPRPSRATSWLCDVWKDALWPEMTCGTKIYCERFDRLPHQQREYSSSKECFDGHKEEK